MGIVVEKKKVTVNGTQCKAKEVYAEVIELTGGDISIRLYNRKTANIVAKADYSGDGEVQQAKEVAEELKATLGEDEVLFLNNNN